MWIIDSATQEVVWTTESLYAADVANDDHEDEGFWSDEEDEAARELWDDMAYDLMVEDAAMEAGLFGWDA